MSKNFLLVSSVVSVLLTIVFIAARLAGFVAWPWYWLISPALATFVVVFILVAIVVYRLPKK